MRPRTRPESSDFPTGRPQGTDRQPRTWSYHRCTPARGRPSSPPVRPGPGARFRANASPAAHQAVGTIRRRRAESRHRHGHCPNAAIPPPAMAPATPAPPPIASDLLASVSIRRTVLLNRSISTRYSRTDRSNSLGERAVGSRSPRPARIVAAARNKYHVLTSQILNIARTPKYEEPISAGAEDYLSAAHGAPGCCPRPAHQSGPVGIDEPGRVNHGRQNPPARFPERTCGG